MSLWAKLYLGFCLFVLALYGWAEFTGYSRGNCTDFNGGERADAGDYPGCGDAANDSIRNQRLHGGK